MGGSDLPKAARGGCVQAVHGEGSASWENQQAGGMAWCPTECVALRTDSPCPDPSCIAGSVPEAMQGS